MYKFPYIETINDVLPSIKDHPEFIVIDKDDYQIIDYVYTTEDSFPPVVDYNTAILRECRGIIFDKNGKLIRRNIHKFFNFNQVEETQVDKIDWNRPHAIYEKLDGSNIGSFFINGKCIWGTRKGETEISEYVNEFIKEHPYYLEFAEWMERINYSPSFEYCSKANRVVIEHPIPKLVLIAIREKNYGSYMDYYHLCKTAEPYNIEVVKQFDFKHENVIEFIKTTRESKDKNLEGYVVKFDNFWIKCKRDEYVEIHRTKDIIQSEAKVISLILNDVVDDILPLLMDIDKERVLKYQKEFMTTLYGISHMMMSELITIKLMYSRKEFSLGPANDIDRTKRSIYYSAWDNHSAENIWNIMRSVIRKNLTNANKFAIIKESLFRGVKYDY